MSMYNSSIKENSDDSDITIINPSMLNDDDDQTTARCMLIGQHLHQASNTEQGTPTAATSNSVRANNSQEYSGDSRSDYIFVDYDPLTSSKQILQVLTFYRNDLKQETTTESDCSRQLTTRLFDFIRPAFALNRDEMTNVQALYDEITSLQNERQIAHNQRIEQLNTEIRHLKHAIATVTIASSTSAAGTVSHSMPSTLENKNNHLDEDQLIAMNEESKRLHELIASQQNQIDELISLMPCEGTNSCTCSIPKETIEKVAETANRAGTPAGNIILEKLRKLIGHRSTTQAAAKIEIENPSPGMSPSESLQNLLTKTLEERTSMETTNETPEVLEEPNKSGMSSLPAVPQLLPASEDLEQLDTSAVASLAAAPQFPRTSEDLEQSNASVATSLPAVPQPPPVSEEKQCPVCNHIFPDTISEEDMYNHLERCLSPNSAPLPVMPKYFECPNCNRKFPSDDESAYLQHLSDCYNRDIHTF